MTAPDVPHRFELELEVSGTPDEVWEAIASGPGISSWMMPTELEPRVGGAVVFRMGPEQDSRGRVTAFEPGHRIEYEEDWATLTGHPDADVTPLVTEFLVEARSGGTCTVTVVSSAFGTGADWEHEFWADMTTGWAPVLDNLRLYLQHFSGQPAAWLEARAPFAGAPKAAMDAVRDGLGAPAVGDVLEVAGVRARLERSIEHHLLLRAEAPVPGLLSFFSFGGEDEAVVFLQGHLFSRDAASYVDAAQATWQSWLEAVTTGAASARP